MEQPLQEWYGQPFSVDQKSASGVPDVKEQFLTLMAHELRTPLSVIQLAIQTMEITCSGDLTPKIKKHLHHIQQNAYKQMRLVNNMLDILRIGSGRLKLNKSGMELVSFTGSILSFLQPYTEPRELSVRLHSESSALYVDMDEEKYTRIMLNLLSNAIKFAPQGTSVDVRIARDEPWVRLSVRDEGPGIPRKKLDLILSGGADGTLAEQAESSGIGLFLVKHFSEALGGGVLPESAHGTGSFLNVLLPNANEGVDCRSEASHQLSTAESRLRQAVAIEFSYL